ncbi:aldehyde dehydrogenase domain-containing protein [Cunninghamella echinulata]|nr:aldehyde dehydrogenase domain-containing protein [Cunninghamella echinulata]
MSKFVINHTTSQGFDLKLQTGLFIDNDFVEGAGTIDTINPSTEQVICSVHAADANLVNTAVDSAEKAYNEIWSKTSALERQRLLLKLADLVERDTEELAQIETLDNGKPISQARNHELPFVIDCIRYYAGYCDKVHGKTIPTPGCLSYTKYEPYGVVAGIIPWNVPLIMFSWKIAPALAAGNTIVIKTSEITALSALKMASLIKEAGFPAGVVNVITGYGHIAGDALARHHKVKKIAFTGSGNVGRLIMKASAETNFKNVTLELGGKSPNIIFDDLDDQSLEQAVKYTYIGIFSNSGQICYGGSRVFVQDGIYDRFIEKFKSIIQNNSIGDPHNESTKQGPQISKTQMDRVLEYIESGKSEGALITAGGKRYGDKGYFIEPTIFTNVTPDMRIMKEEIFGPVVCVARFKDTAEVIKSANETIYGLAAGVFTQKITRAVEVSDALQAGTVWVNMYGQFDCNTPFGGYHQSGIGRELGQEAMSNYYQIKSVKININRNI